MKKSVVLTGMMGVGKTTIGITLQKLIKFKFIDMDTLIEKKEGKTIKNIFDTNGEKYFRNLEKKEAIKYLKREKLEKIINQKLI